MDYTRILVTGAAGQVGRLARKVLSGRVPHLRLSDIALMPPAGEQEELWSCDLADAPAVAAMLRGVDAVVHLGASLNVDDWQDTLRVNIAGSYNIYESARQAGVKRIVYASSHHAVGMYGVDERIDTDAPGRPDSLYGLSKCFGEDLARYYWDKYGIESVCLRIGSARPRPNESRELATWLSEPDFERLLLASLGAPSVGHTVIFGVSDNKESWWDNERSAARLGYVPQDDADVHADRVHGQVDRGESPGPYPLQGGKRAEYGLVRDGKGAGRS
ncbi:MAG: NAD(P)-dependent oxidoreductase [Burkholderiaceae bacterium]